MVNNSLKQELKKKKTPPRTDVNSRLEPFLVKHAIKRGEIKINNVNNFTNLNYTRLKIKYAKLFTPGRLHMLLRHENFNRKLNGNTQQKRTTATMKRLKAIYGATHNLKHRNEPWPTEKSPRWGLVN